MQFDYYSYFRQNCLNPFMFCVLSTVAFVVSVFCVIDNMKKKRHRNVKAFLYENINSVFIMIIMIGLIFANIPPLARGGIYLLFEKEEDAIVFMGEIEDIFEITSFGGMRYDVEQNHGYGEGVVINSNKYYLMTYGNYKKGDMVSIKVLPKSKLILEIEGL